MSDRRLKVFHTVARLLSFTKAAEELHMTQPAVTFQVRQLEEYFNTRLFDRTHNKVNLTPAGERVAEFAERIFDLYSEMENSVRDLTGEISGALTIGASTTIAEYMLPALLGEFKNQYPDINLRFKVSNSEGIVSMVEHNVIDLGVVESPVSNKNLIVEVCHDDQLVVVAAPDHELVKRGGKVDASDIVQYPFVSREEGSGTREVIMQYLTDAGVSAHRHEFQPRARQSRGDQGRGRGGYGHYDYFALDHRQGAQTQHARRTATRPAAQPTLFVRAPAPEVPRHGDGKTARICAVLFQE